MAAKAKLAEKPKPSKSAKTKDSKPAEAKPAAAKPPVTKPTATKPAAATKAAKATPKAKLKPVKSPARSKDKPAVAPEHIVAPQQPGAEPELDVYYVTLEPLPAHIRSGESGAAGQALAFASFAEAKERVIDHLIELIEEAERRLHVLRRASNRDEYPH